MSSSKSSSVDVLREALAYVDTTHDLGHGRVLSAPAPFAKLLQLAEIQSTDAVLDLGVGTGYSTAVLAQLAHGRVIGTEPFTHASHPNSDNGRDEGSPSTSVMTALTDFLSSTTLRDNRVVT